MNAKELLDRVAERIMEESHSLGASEKGWLLSPLMVYQMGTALYHAAALRSSTAADRYGPSHKHSSSGVDPYQTLRHESALLVESGLLAKSTLHLIHQAFGTLVAKHRSKGENGDDTTAAELLEAVRSLCGIYISGSKVCVTGFQVELCVALVSLYDDAGGIHPNASGDASSSSLSSLWHEMAKCILATLDHLLMHGLLLPLSTAAATSDEALEEVLQVVQALTADERSCCLGDVLEYQEQGEAAKFLPMAKDRPSSLDKVITVSFPSSPQRDYLTAMLKSCPRTTTSNMSITATTNHDTEAPTRQGGGKKKAGRAKRDTNNDEDAMLQSLMNQVRGVLPDLGEGFVEVALACYGNDPSRTVAALLEAQAQPSSLHPRLRVLDPNLPARHRRRQDWNDDSEDAEAKQTQKAWVFELERQAERDAYLLQVGTTTTATTAEEYNDDYDDQYDTVNDNAVGGTDGGLYDMDYDTIRDYNRAARAAEKEDAFWEENRNKNRASRSPKRPNGHHKEEEEHDEDTDGKKPHFDDDDDDEQVKKYRGPDKGRGGRILGPDGKYLARGGGGGRGRGGGGKKGNGGAPPAVAGAGTDSDNMSKLQKRRKNDNKAKVANHHRKERAAKKAANGGGGGGAPPLG